MNTNKDGWEQLFDEVSGDTLGVFAYMLFGEKEHNCEFLSVAAKIKYQNPTKV